MKIDSKILLGLPHEMLKALDKEAKKLKLNRTRLIRRLISKYLAEQEVNETFVRKF